MRARYGWGSVSRISPESPVPIVKLERETCRPGGAASVAANAAALGARGSLVGLVGNDRDAEDLKDAINNFRLSRSGLVPSDTRRTTVKTRIVAHGQQVTRLDNEDIAEISADEFDRLLSDIRENISEHDVLIISDYGKGLVSARFAQELISLGREYNVPVLADPKGKHFEKYSRATALTPNRREAAEACKLEESTPDLVGIAGLRLLIEHELESVLITESENGMTLFRRDHDSEHFDAVAKEVFDVTGAGDTVIACLGTAIAAGFPMVEAARLANIAAGVSVQRIGTSAISAEELRDEVEKIADGSQTSALAQ